MRQFIFRLLGLDLGKILSQFDKVDAKLHRYLDHLTKEQTKNANRQVALREAQRQTEAQGKQLVDSAARALRVQARIQEFKS